MDVVIIGAGGHAQVVADILLTAQAAGQAVRPIGYVDDNPALRGHVFVTLPVLGALADIPRITHQALIVALGNNATRRQVFLHWQAQGEQFVTARHPQAVIGREVQVGVGVMICAGVVINPGSQIGDNVILNTGCTIDHHNLISAHVHVAPGVHMGGEVQIGEGALIGIGATIMPRCSVGAWSSVGAGAVVHHPIPSQLTVVGVPARPLVTSSP